MDNEKSTKKVVKTVKDIEKVIILMKKHRVSEIEVDGVSIKINAFEPPPLKPEPKPSPQEGDDEDLFWSARPN